VAGNFFESVPAGVDAYVCTTVLHDWNDEKSGEILDVIHKATSPGAKLLLGELVIPEETTYSISKLMSGIVLLFPSLLLSTPSTHFMLHFCSAHDYA